MNETLAPQGTGPFALIAIGIGLLLTLVLGTWLLRLVPMTRGRRELAGRAIPVIAAIAIFAYLFFAVGTLFRADPDSIPYARAALLLVLGAASWFAIRDIIAGLFIKAGRVCRVGDHVQIGDVKGRVERMGLRVMSVETSQGEEAILPYGSLTRSSLLRSPVVEGAALHVFEVELSTQSAVSNVRRIVRQSALNSHWSSAVRSPEVVAVTPNRFEVTLFALDADYAPVIEAAVRAALTESEAGGR